MKMGNKRAGDVTANDVLPAVTERSLTLVVKKLLKGKHYIWLTILLAALFFGRVYVEPLLISNVSAGEVLKRPKKGAEITSPRSDVRMPREIDVSGNVWGLREDEKLQLEIQTEEGYFHRDVMIQKERFKREKTHLGSLEHDGKKDPDAGKAFRLQMVVIKKDVIPNRHRLEHPIPCERISKPVNFIRRPMLPNEA